jgi:hypothetical protein
MKFEILYNPGNVVCDYLNVKDDHKFILRIFVNLTYYGHIFGALALYISKHINF